MWANGIGFHKLVGASGVAPSVIAEQLGYHPQYVIVFSHGSNEHGPWANISCAEWTIQTQYKAVNLDWHAKLAVQLSKGN